MFVVNISKVAMLRSGWIERREAAGCGWRHPQKPGVEIWISGPYGHAALFEGDIEKDMDTAVARFASWGLGFSEYWTGPTTNDEPCEDADYHFGGPNRG